ncbi:MAG: VOC family protein [Mycobacterium leprae]
MSDLFASVHSMTLYVADEAEALRFYTEKLGFEKRMDVTLAPGTRWLTIGLPGQAEPEIVLHNPSGWHGEKQAAQLRELIGQAPPICLYTRDCRTTAEKLKANGVTFMQEPAERPYGVEAVFADLYGNAIVLVEPRS